MYYVIQHVRGNPTKHYTAYTITRYITSENSQNVIMEFQKDSSLKRKWAPKEIIILVTADKEVFKSALEQLESIRAAHMEKINTIKTQLDHEVAIMVNEFQEQFILIKARSDV